jgi:hypothetical protein
MPTEFAPEAERKKWIASGVKYALGGFLFFGQNDLS